MLNYIQYPYACFILYVDRDHLMFFQLYHKIHHLLFTLKLNPKKNLRGRSINKTKL